MVVTVEQARSAVRRRANALVAAFVLFAITLVVVPPASAAPTCLARIDSVDASPLYADHGQEVVLGVQVSDANPAPEPPGARNQVDVTIQVRYNESVAPDFEDTIAVSVPPTGSARVETALTIAGAAREGLANITVQLDNSRFTDPCTLDQSGLPNAPAFKRNWGFWVEERTDLEILAVSLVRHLDGDDPVQDGQHLDAPFLEAQNFTRYPGPGTLPNVCQEENAQFFGRGHFKVTLRNSGAAPFSLPVDTPGGLPLKLRFKDGPETLGEERATVEIEAGETVDRIFNGTLFRLLNRAGFRSISVEVDVDNAYAEENEGNNLFTSPADKARGVYLRAPDLTGALKDVRRTARGEVEGRFNMTNAGDHRAGVAPSEQGRPQRICHSHDGGPVTARVFVNRVAPEQEVRSESRTLEPGERTEDIRFVSDFQIGAGTTRVILLVDCSRVNASRPGGCDDNANELNETNNRVDFLLQLEDTQTPVLRGVAVATPENQRIAGAAVSITGNVSDDADFQNTEENRIFLDFTLPDGTNATFVPTALRANATEPLRINWWFNTTSCAESAFCFAQEGSYAFRVRAVDGANHTAEFPPAGEPPLSFVLTSFPKAVELFATEVCEEASAVENVSRPVNCVSNQASPNQTVGAPFGGGTNVVRITFRVPPGSTGLFNESRNLTRKTVQLWAPDGPDADELPEEFGNFTVVPVCWNSVSNSTVDCPTDTPVNETCGLTAPVCYNFLFRLQLGGNNNVNQSLGLTPPNHPTQPCQTINQTRQPRLDRPGAWNFTFWVGDAACKFKYHGHHSTLGPAPPLFKFELWDLEPAQIRNVTPPDRHRVDALQRITFRADATDNIRVLRAFVQATTPAPDRRVLNENMTGPTGPNAVPETGNGTYTLAVTAGEGGPFDLAGDYTWRIGVLDANHTLNFSGERRFTVVDIGPPSIRNEAAAFARDGTPSNAFQVGTEIVLQADIEDDTRLLTKEGIVQNAAGAEVLRVNLTRVAGTLYRSRNLTTGPGQDLPEGSYTFLVRAVDSAGKSGEVGGRFRVAGNLPPAFLRLTPPGGGFGRPGGEASVDISDTLHGVDRGSIAVRFGVNTPGETNETLEAPALRLETLERSGALELTVRAAFSLPAQAVHGDLVTVNVSAADLSEERLQGSTQWEFRLDGVAPRSTLACAPAHPRPCGEGEEGLRALRGDAPVTITATDADPQGRAVSGVARIRFALDPAGATGQAREAEGASATFALRDLVAEDGSYTLRWRAVDAAGNEEREQRQVFLLDSRGPDVQNVVATPGPAGWDVTATITDLAADVRSARLFHRTGATAFALGAMERVPEAPEVWRGSIPGARRGVQVCYYVEAEDFLGNVGGNGTASSPVCFQAENHPPQLEVLSPREGEVAGATLTVRWQVSDIDGDPVSVSVGYRREGDVAFTRVPLSVAEQGSRTAVLDTAELAPGRYLLRVEATDNQAFNNRTAVSRNITIGGEGPVGRPVLSADSVAPGEVVTVRVEIARAVRDVEAILLRGSEEVAREPMEPNPPGSRFWEATFRVEEPGLYEVEVRGVFEDGTPFTIKAASTLRVEGGLLGAGLDAVLIVGLAAAVLALAALGLRRRGGA